MNNSAILWRGFFLPGHEACRVFSEGNRWYLDGAANFSHDQQPCRLDYLVTCDANWVTKSARVAGRVGEKTIKIDLSVDKDQQRWLLNGVEQPAVDGCVDVDLNFSPSTNLLPIRRLNLSVGEFAEVNAAWLRFPSFELEPLMQVYRRLDDNTYRYESHEGKYTAELKVNSIGLVTSYPGVWEQEKS